MGHLAVAAVDDLAWLTDHGNPALIADVVVAFGALRAALSGARVNVGFDLANLQSAGMSLDEIRMQQPLLWASTTDFDRAIDRIDGCVSAARRAGALRDSP